LAPIYWLSWITLLACSIGLWIAVLGLGVLASGCVVGYAQT
jgi:hypothetical protein